MNQKQTEQRELLMISVRHIMKQGEASVDEDGVCAYRGAYGLSCAAEPFITDYVPEMEGNLFLDLVQDYPKRINSLAAKHDAFVHQLQRCHDVSAGRSRFISSYRSRVDQAASTYGLDPVDWSEFETVGATA